MLISSIGGQPPATSVTPNTRQQTELVQGSNADSSSSSAVLPSSSQAVLATGQTQTQQQTGNGTSQKKSTQQDLQNAVKQLNDAAAQSSSQLQFSVDKSTGIEVVKVIDPETNQVIRQIPSEDAIRIAKAIGDFKGLLIKDEA